ncbi:MAG: HmuY family protein, partial [Leptospirales bacterium]
GAAAGGACQTGVMDFASVTSVSAFAGGAAPDCPVFSTDTPLQGAGAGGGSVAFNGSPALKDWYAYNIFTHALTAKGDVYIIRSSDGAKYYKLQMIDYYDSAGAAGYPKLRYQEIVF